MSRSYLKDKFKKKQFEKYDKDDCLYYAKHGHNKNNKHRRDEVPKNKPSKHITSKCAKAEWLQEPSNFCGHKPHKNGHRMVSGIVRAKTKKEIKNEINSEVD